MNTGMANVDKECSQWVKMLLFESCTSEMRELVMVDYSELDVHFHGGITFAWILCDKIFSLNRDTTVVLRKFIKLFETKGLCCYHRENVVWESKELVAACT